MPAFAAAWLRAAPAAAALTCWAMPAQAAGDFITLRATDCQSVSADTALPPAWEPFRAATRVCALRQRPAQTASVRLLSVFTDDYYRQLPADAPWQAFPLPRLVDVQGTCLGQLPHLYPVDPPQELVVRAGHWRQGRPHEVRLRVLSPTVSGNYSLPSLHWNTQAQRYQPRAARAPGSVAATPAPHPSSSSSLPTSTLSQDTPPCP